MGGKKFPRVVRGLTAFLPFLKRNGIQCDGMQSTRLGLRGDAHHMEWDPEGRVEVGGVELPPGLARHQLLVLPPIHTHMA
jgi:hypothetical protein